jgi:hypothetical protein
MVERFLSRCAGAFNNIANQPLALRAVLARNHRSVRNMPMPDQRRLDLARLDPEAPAPSPDKTSKYDTSPNCRAFSDIAKRYIAAGGLKQSAPCVADRIAEGAHAKAWMALAVSKTGDPNLVIW